MELTREQIEGYKKIDNLFGCHIVHKLCDMLIAEMDKQKVWDGAPDDAIIAKVHFYKRDKVYARPDGMPEVYTRELTKSLAREISESTIQSWINEVPSGSMRISDDAMIKLINNVESAIKEALEKSK